VLTAAGASALAEVVQKEPAAEAVERLLAGREPGEVTARFEEIKTDTSRFSFDERAFNRLGYRFIRAGEIKKAIAVLKMAAGVFPDSWNAWDSLGEAYLYDADEEESVRCYEKSLELDPGNEGAKWALEMMDGRVEDMRNETRVPPALDPGENTGLTGAYLGQVPPGTTPEVFAPGIVSARGNFEYALAISPDGTELYFSSHTGLGVCRLEEKGWTAPEPALFARKYPGAFEPHITADGGKMFFGRGTDIWVMDRTGTGWGDARRHGPGMFVTTTLNGDLYVTDISGNTFGIVVFQRLVDGVYTPPDTARGGIYVPDGAAHPCIAPDESFIIFDSWREGTLGQADLFMCVRQEDGSWGDAIHLPAGINTAGENIAATLSPDGKYLFFTTNNDIYWVSTDALAPLMKR